MKLINCKNLLKVGMEVKEVRGGYVSECIQLQNGQTVTITRINEDGVWFNTCPHSWTENIELALTPSWDNLYVGLTIVHPDGTKDKILEVFPSGKTFMRSCWSGHANWETIAGDIHHIEEAKRLGWKIMEAEEEETIEVLGKKYNKEKVIKALEGI
jgi:hypothetical protein